ncbi:Mitochondrial presequence protease [Lecanora helva]
MLRAGSHYLKHNSSQSLKWSSSRHLKWTSQRRCLASVTDISGAKPGENIHGFSLKRKRHVPELQLTAFDLEHDKTGAEYLHVERDDQNNVFSIGFKTNPPDDTGVPHILEHTTLCGSQRYPVRDPFFKMLPRSLSNFMNALTSSDHTYYPFATTNKKDFKNLMSVYLDATLHPLLNEKDFTQEGWRIGPENPAAAPDTNLVFKGVVYNEMKGQMSDASYLYYIRFRDHIFPDLNNSGGDPSKMTNLSYQNLKDFHLRNYHPSNAKVFTYGNMPLADHLEEVGRQLDGFKKIQVDKAIKTPIDLKKGPLNYTIKGPLDPLVDQDMQYKTSTSWLMGDNSNIIENFALGIISSLLTDGYGSPLYQALIEAGLGTDWSPNTGFDTDAKVGVFSIGLNGVREHDVPRAKTAIQSKLREVHREGFDKSKVDGILHQLELALKHKTANFGMGLMQRIQSGWFNGVDPIEALAWDNIVKAFKERFAAEGYLENLLEKYLLNDQTLTFTMVPSATYGEVLAQEESTRLAQRLSDVTQSAGGEAEARQQLIMREGELLKAQHNASNQDVSCLPSVHISDVPRVMDRKPVRDSDLDGVKVQWREADTNGLTYFRAVHTLAEIPGELRMLIPLFNDSIMRLGTKTKTMEEIEDLIKLKTGGISTSYYASPSPADMNSYSEGLSFSGYALDGNIPAMYELLRMVIQETDFDGPEAESKIRQLLQADASGALDAVASSGHSYARRAVEAALTPYGSVMEQVGGLTQVQQTANLANRSPTEGIDDVIAKLKLIQQHAISNSSKLRVALTCGQESASSNETALKKFLSQLPDTVGLPKVEVATFPTTQNSKMFYTLPYQVSFSAQALPTVSYIHPAGAPLQVLSQLLTHKHLHHEIREKGGAYGGGAYSRGLSGLFGYHSYRDPNPQNTMKIMQDAGRWARDRHWTDQDIEEAKLSIFQNVDAPQSVSEEGMVRFTSGIDFAMEQTKREQMLDVRREDVRDIAQRYLVDGMKESKVAVLGEQKEWVIENEGWVIKKLELSNPSGPLGANDLKNP